MAVVFVFMLARVSEAMLILHAHQNFGLAEKYTPLILIIYNGANALASYPVGRLSDSIDRRVILQVGFLVLILADILLGFAPNIWVMLAGVGVWGVQIGMTQSMFMALIADNVPDDLRGTGFGFYYLISAVSLILASTIGGFIAQHFGEGTTFLVSCAIGCVSLLMLMAMVRKRTHSK
jgi:MFS family permease